MFLHDDYYSLSQFIFCCPHFQCFPMAYILELAGGAASDGYKPILDIVPDGLHVRSPIYLGNKEDVAEVDALIAKHEGKK